MGHPTVRNVNQKRWNIMRTAQDIHPVTGEEEHVRQCILVSDEPVTETKLNELRSKYNEPSIWVEPAGVFH